MGGFGITLRLGTVAADGTGRNSTARIGALCDLSGSDMTPEVMQSLKDRAAAGALGLPACEFPSKMAMVP